jgi:hypothetical protein
MNNHVVLFFIGIIPLLIDVSGLGIDVEGDATTSLLTRGRCLLKRGL